jgi:hypothetical protein
MMSNLQVYMLDAGDHLLPAESEHHRIQGKDPAIHLMLDIHDRAFPRIHHASSAQHAEKLLAQLKVPALIVLDDHDDLLGIVSRDMLNPQAMLSQVTKNIRVEDLTVRTFAQTRDELFVLDFYELEHRTCDEAFEALKTIGTPVCLVVDHRWHSIKGLLIASEIAKWAGVNLSDGHAATFSQLVRKLHS